MFRQWQGHAEQQCMLMKSPLTTLASSKQLPQNLGHLLVHSPEFGCFLFVGMTLDGTHCAIWGHLDERTVIDRSRCAISWSEWLFLLWLVAGGWYVHASSLWLLKQQRKGLVWGFSGGIRFVALPVVHEAGFKIHLGPSLRPLIAWRIPWWQQTANPKG